MSGPRVTVHTARRAYTCRATHWSPGGWSEARAYDGGPIPADHRTSIRPGQRYAQWQQYGETQRCCAACARAAGLMP